MKKLIAGLIMAALALTGCNTSTSTPAGSTGTSSPRASGYQPNEAPRPPVAAHTSPAPVAGETTRAPAATEPGRGGAPAIGGSGDSFTLTGPGVLGTSDVTLKQGEKKEIKIGVSPGSNFKEGIRLEVKNAPPGLTVTPAKPDVPAGDKQFMVTVEAGKDASPGTHTVDLIGTPEGGKGGDQTLHLKINVEKAG